MLRLGPIYMESCLIAVTTAKFIQSAPVASLTWILLLTRKVSSGYQVQRFTKLHLDGGEAWGIKAPEII